MPFNNSLHPTTGPVTTLACARPAPDPVAGEPNVRLEIETTPVQVSFGLVKGRSINEDLFLSSYPVCIHEL